MQTADHPIAPTPASPEGVVRDYHERTKHRPSGYAAGPEALDWDAQPASFRSYGCATRIALPLLAELTPDADEARAFERPFGVPVITAPAREPTLATLGVLLQASLGITAFKSYGPDRWTVRANPSSGNLHPTEAYVIAQDLPFLADGVYHYLPEHHALEQRGRFDGPHAPLAGLFVALSSAMWRESWKYGERAFRYCQLDIGHAVGALAVACATLGLTLREESALDTATLHDVLGLDRDAASTSPTEREEAELLLRIALEPPAPLTRDALRALSLTFDGHPSVLDARPRYAWPVVDEVARASRRLARARLPTLADAGIKVEPNDSDLTRDTAACSNGAQRPSVARVVLGRRSAQRFDARHVMPRAAFHELLSAVLPCQGAPWTTLAAPPRIDIVLFVHRVEALASGVYLLARRGTASEPLRARLATHFDLHDVSPSAPALPLARLSTAEPRELSRFTRAVHCQQDIASTACIALGMIAEFEAPIAEDPAAYRDLHREAGAIGQLLYLTAEAHGLRGTGIGCYFDDAVHALLGLTDARYQSLYHFTVGRSLDDPRIEASAPYPERSAR